MYVFHNCTMANKASETPVPPAFLTDGLSLEDQYTPLLSALMCSIVRVVQTAPSAIHKPTNIKTVAESRLH